MEHFLDRAVAVAVVPQGIGLRDDVAPYNSRPLVVLSSALKRGCSSDVSAGDELTRSGQLLEMGGTTWLTTTTRRGAGAE